MPVEEIQPIYTDPMSTGNTAMAAVYRLTDSTGCIWRSAPRLLLNAVYVDATPSSAVAQWLIVPTLRHLMAGTTAQIEIYIVSDVDLQLLYVCENDPTTDYLEFCVNVPGPGHFNADPTALLRIDQAIASRPVGETLYTNGGGIPAIPPPQMECAVAWRNRIFGCFQNTIYPSQEFATGLGLQWATETRVEWHEGTGDILGVCPVDWNYLAVFKRDAIGILSGSGPDGLGHGNYIVQTLATKAGCTNPRSLVNGPDGCYYQDAATGRVMLLSPDMQVREAMPGAFDTFTTSATVTCALHVEALRQVWFTVQNTLLVLDYKHKTASAVGGQVYTWPVYVSAAPSGMAIVGSAPVLMLATNDTAAQVASQYYDQNVATTKTAVNRIIETGDVAPIGLQRQCNIDRVQVLGEYQSAHTLKITTYPDFATSGTAVQVNVTAAPLQVSTRPPNCQRVQAIRLRVEDVLAAVSIMATLTTTGAAISALSVGSQTLEITAGGTVYSFVLDYSAFRDVSGSASTVEIQLAATIPIGVTITLAHIAPGTAFSGTGVTTAQLSVRRYAGTLGEILSGTGDACRMTISSPGTNPASGALSLASSATVATPVYGAGSKLVGFGLVVQDAGKLVDVDVGRII